VQAWRVTELKLLRCCYVFLFKHQPLHRTHFCCLWSLKWQASMEQKLVGQPAARYLQMNVYVNSHRNAEAAGLRLAVWVMRRGRMP